jgi:predicted O-methyltransferase YrrM
MSTRDGDAPSVHAAAMGDLDRWVALRGNRSYLAPDDRYLDPLSIFPDSAIQQVREEISGLALELIKRDLRGSILEIGLGYYGSTHVLWRRLFDRVVTIEKAPERVRAFARSLREFEGEPKMVDGRSGVIVGGSYEPGVVAKAYDAFPNGVDVLFIDADHTYPGVLTDWLLFHNLVRSGGLVVFHDVLADDGRVLAVPRLLRQLEAGQIDGITRTIHTITHSQIYGIGFYEVA